MAPDVHKHQTGDRTVRELLIADASTILLYAMERGEVSPVRAFRISQFTI